MAYSPAPAAPMIDSDYERDCPRCGDETRVNSTGGQRFCKNPNCPWCVVKGSL